MRWKALLLAAAGSTALAAPALADIQATVLIADQPAGSYREETLVRDGRIQDTVEQHFIFNREGTRVEISETDVFQEDTDGRLLSGHSEVSSSKTSVVTDFTVRGDVLALTTRSGGRDYTTETPLSGPLLGPAGARRLMAQASEASPTETYRTFAASLGGVAEIRLTYLGAETVGGAPRRKFGQVMQGVPGTSIVWTDAGGRTVQMTMDSPFGPIRIVQGEAPATEGAQLPAESYDSTLAVSNIQLPHPRALDMVTVELTKRPGAEAGWPHFASPHQKVLQRTADRLVLQITRPTAGDTSGSPGAGDTAGNALLQSDAPEVIALARQIVGEETDPWRKALRLQAWVAANMVFDTGIAVAPASELIRDRHGTCVGYAILLGSLARAEGIPARIRMGYVYDHGIWGGHAWIEAFLRGAWLPLDSAEYQPGVADAARIGAITARGDNGAIEGVGDLALLFGKVDIRTLAYRRDGHTVTVGRSDADHRVSGDLYSNPWLGLSVHKPADLTFANLKAHWPDIDVLQMRSATDTIRLVSLTADDRPMNATLAEALHIDGPGRPTQWNGVPATRIDTAGRSVMAVADKDVIWALVAEGPAAASLLDTASPGVRLPGAGR